MSNHCKITPDAPNGKPSILFNDLKRLLGDRELAKKAWGFTQTDMFKSAFRDIALDENGEPTLEEVSRILDLDKITSSTAKERELAISMGVATKSGDTVKFDLAQSAIDAASRFNEKANKSVAVVEQTDDNLFEVKISDNVPSEVAKSDRTKALADLNKALIRLIQRAGFDVSFTNDPGYNGVFNPLLADQNANTLRTVIDVANNKEGTEALPEEVSHLILAGLRDHALKQRIDKIFTDDLVRAVLGEDYNRYRELYKNGNMPVSERLREEAEGKILAGMLTKNPVDFTKNSKLTIERNEYTDEFRRLQDESRSIPPEQLQRIQSQGMLDAGRRRIGRILEGLLGAGSNGSGNNFRISLTGKRNTFNFARVNGTLFHDVFEVTRTYLQNGELVDLHDDYENAKCFLSEDGLCGFAIEDDGNLVSVFSLNPSDRGGFLYSIKDFIREQGATHLDAYASKNQNLEQIYGKTLGFHTASRMDYNMEYDHDNIAQNHGRPDVVFMVASQDEVEERHFDENSYDEAVDYQHSYIKSKEQIEPSSGKSLFSRLWDHAKGLFRKISRNEVDNAIVNAENAFRPIVEMMQDGSINTVIDKELIMQHEPLYELSDRNDKIEQMVQDGETILSKKLYILQNTSVEQDTESLSKSIQQVRKNLENQRYALACYHVMAAIGKDTKQLMQQTAQMGHVYANSKSLDVISSEAGLVNRLVTSVQAYIPYLETLSTLPHLIERGDVEMDEAWGKQIADMANEYLSHLRTMQKEIRQMRFSVLRQLISLYYGDDGQKPKNYQETDNNKWESIDMILSQADRDISWVDTNLFSAGDSRNPLLNIIHKIVVSQQAKRNNEINKLCMKMQEADKKLRDAGYDNNFIYQYDAEGKPTGYFVAPIDMAKYERDRKEFLESLNMQDLDYYELKRKITEWDEAHTEEVEVGEPITVDGKRRTEIHPKKSIYGVTNFQAGWSQAQKDYYNAVISMKAEMDSYIPVPMQSVYTAPQVRKSVTQMFDKDGQGALRTLWGNWKQKFAVVDDNDEYGKDVSYVGEDGRKHVLLDFEGKPIKRVPIYFVHKLEDERDLCTDGTRAMFNYITMAINYGAMGELAQAMQLMRDHVQQDYEVIQTDAGATMVDMFKSLGETYERDYVKKGEGTNVARAIVDYIDRQFFNETKNKLGDFKLPVSEKTVSKDALFNLFMRLTSVARMGFNVLSGITNVAQGKTQILAEATANRYFNLKDVAWSNKEYMKLLPNYLRHFNSADRHDKMYLLINQFNSSEDFFRDMRDKDFNKSSVKRVMGRGNVYFLNTMGEHNLHTEGMLMVLHHEKVKRLSQPNAEPVSLYDVIKEVHDENGWHLELEDDIEFVDKNRAFLQAFHFGDERAVVKKSDRDKLFEELAQYINKINADMHGGYSEAEKGNANRQMVWRLILQFRQWMFGMYNKLYSRSYYDAVMGVQREGGYVSMLNFITGTLHDMKNMSLKAAIENNQLTQEQKENVRVAMATAGAFVMCCILAAMTAGWKDGDDDRMKRMLAYTIKRLQTETGALVPSTAFFKNAFTLIQSPAAGTRTAETLFSIFDVSGMWDEINSGRYKGWSKWEKAVYTSTPIYNIQKVIDMKDYNYMFNIFK